MHTEQMQLIITRPQADATALANKLQSLGHHCIMMPLLNIVPRKNVKVPRHDWQAICITSANGILNGEILDHLRTITVHCVGPQSATAAKAKGFANVFADGGDVLGLVAAVKEKCNPAHGPVLYLSGATTSGDLQGQLTAAGFDVTRLVTYDAVAETPAGLDTALPLADGVLLYSPRSAALWVSQVEKSQAQQHIGKIMHYCLSPAVAAKLPSLWPRRIANTPDEGAMLAFFNAT